MTTEFALKADYPAAGPDHSACRSGVAASPRTEAATAVILAGGRSSRMGSNKALLPYRGGRFIEAIHRQLAEIFDEVLLVTNSPEQYAFIPCRKAPDLFPGMGALAGIHSGLHHSSNPVIFAVACDMPYLNGSLIRHLASRADADGVLIPEGPRGPEPLHAFYGKGCLGAMEAALRNGERRVVSFFGCANVEKVSAEQVAGFDPAFASFSNVNTPEEYFRLREWERHGLAADGRACGALLQHGDREREAQSAAGR